MSETQTISVSVAYADEYFAKRLHTDAWTTASDEDKEKAINWAGVIIRNAFLWEDEAYDAESESWDEAVYCGVCEEALWLLKLDPSEYPAILTKGLASGTAGAVSGTFSREMTAPLVSPTAASLIGVLGTLNDDTAGWVKSTMLGG